jgi:hypothetical protein
MVEKVFRLADNLTISLRFVLPILFGLFMYNYSQDQQRVRQDVENVKNTITSQATEIKENQKALWNAFNDRSSKNESKFDFIFTQCCKDATSVQPRQ